MSTTKNIPELFQELIRQGLMAESNIHTANDGFCAADCALNQYDGGYLYAVPARSGFVYGIFTLSDQNDIEPGVEISFAAVDPKTMLADSVPSKAIKSYFCRPQSIGAYLIARLYTKYIARERHIQLPCYYEMFRTGEAWRISRFIEINNEDAVHAVCDQQTIYIRDLENVSNFENLAILATHTGCTGYQNFAAGVQYHARAFGKDAAAKLTVTNYSAPYHNTDSKWMKQQRQTESI